MIRVMLVGRNPPVLTDDDDVVTDDDDVVTDDDDVVTDGSAAIDVLVDESVVMDGSGAGETGTAPGVDVVCGGVQGK